MLSGEGPACFEQGEVLCWGVHITTALGVCSLAGCPVAVRLAFPAAAQDAAKLEVAAYERLADLQGIHVPRLLVHGHTEIRGMAALFVATEFVKVLRRSLTDKLILYMP